MSKKRHILGTSASSALLGGCAIEQKEEGVSFRDFLVLATYFQKMTTQSHYHWRHSTDIHHKITVNSSQLAGYWNVYFAD